MSLVFKALGHKIEASPSKRGGRLGSKIEILT